MESELIIITEYCNKSDIEQKFLVLLESEGLIETQWINGIQYIPVSQLGDVERFARLHYDLSINIEGIDAINTLLNRVNEMRSEIIRLRHILEPHRGEDYLDFDNDLFN